MAPPNLALLFLSIVFEYPLNVTFYLMQEVMGPPPSPALFLS